MAVSTATAEIGDQTCVGFSDHRAHGRAHVLTSDWPDIARSEAIRTSVFYQRIASLHSVTIPVESNLL
jgi:hypothetical protein